MKHYNEHEFINEKKADLDKINTDVLLRYFKNNVMNKEYLHILNDNTMVNIKIGGDNFFHATGLHHCDLLMNTLYQDITGEPAHETADVVIKHIVKGFTAYKHLLHNKYDLSEDFVSKFEVSRISRFNRLHKVLNNPDSIIKASPNMIKNNGVFSKGDLVFSLSDKGKIHSVVMAYSKDKASWYLKSYLVDRPQYCRFIDDINKENNLKYARLSFNKNDAMGYISKIYEQKYPYVNMFGYNLSADIKSLNEKYGKLLKFDSIKRLAHEARQEITDIKQNNNKIPVSKYNHFKKLQSVVTQISNVEFVYKEELENSINHERKAPSIQNNEQEL